MDNNQFVNLFKRLHPSLNVVIQKDRPSQLPKGYRYIELKTTEQGLAYFDKGIFRFQETPDGFKLILVPNIWEFTLRNDEDFTLRKIPLGTNSLF